MLQQWRKGSHVVFDCWAYVLEHETKRFKNSVLDLIERHSVFVHQGWQDSKGSTSLCNHCNGHRGADSHLPLLNLQIVDESDEHIRRAYRLGNKAQGVDCVSSRLFVLAQEQIEQVHADSDPFFRMDFLRRIVLTCNFSNENDYVCLDLLVSVAKNRGQLRQQFFHRRVRLFNRQIGEYCIESFQKSRQDLGVFFSQVLMNHLAQLLQIDVSVAEIKALREEGNESAGSFSQRRVRGL